jgi:hypothetical protein
LLGLAKARLASPQTMAREKKGFSLFFVDVGGIAPSECKKKRLFLVPIGWILCPTTRVRPLSFHSLQLTYRYIFGNGTVPVLECFKKK